MDFLNLSIIKYFTYNLGITMLCIFYWMALENYKTSEKRFIIVALISITLTPFIAFLTSLFYKSNNLRKL